MQRVLYTARPVLGADRVYCDTSFLLDVYARRAQQRGRAIVLAGQQGARARDATEFYDAAKQAGVSFVTSIFAVEEAFHVLAMAPIRTAIRRSPNSSQSWKAFRISDPTGFATALDSGRRALENFDLFTKIEDIEILSIGKQVTPRQPILEYHLVADARLIVATCEVDVMDAFQYVTMLRFQIAAAASSDSDWMSFPSGTLYTAR